MSCYFLYSAFPHTFEHFMLLFVTPFKPNLDYLLVLVSFKSPFLKFHFVVLVGAGCFPVRASPCSQPNLCGQLHASLASLQNPSWSSVLLCICSLCGTKSYFVLMSTCCKCIFSWQKHDFGKQELMERGCKISFPKCS